MINQRETVIIQSPEQGASSRKRVPLIEQAISQLEDSRKYNRYAICEQLAEIMINKYKETIWITNPEEWAWQQQKKCYRPLMFIFINISKQNDYFYKH